MSTRPVEFFHYRHRQQRHGQDPRGPGAGRLAACQRGSDQRHHLVAGVRPPGGIAQVEALPDEFRQAEMPGQGGRKDQPGIGHQAVIVEGDADAVGVVAW